MSPLKKVKKARKYNPNDAIYRSKEIQTESLDTEESKKEFRDTLKDSVKEFGDTLKDSVKELWFTKQDKAETCDELPEESCMEQEETYHALMESKEELCQNAGCFSSLLDITSDYCMKGLISDERGTPESLVSSWKYALGDDRSPALFEVLTDIENDVKEVRFHDSLPAERRILSRWYSYLCYRGVERPYFAGEIICMDSVRRFEFANSNQFKDNMMCVVKRSPWYCGSVLLVPGTLGKVTDEEDSKMNREETSND